MFEEFKVQSHKGEYRVLALETPFENLKSLPLERCHFVVDRKVADLYRDALAPALGAKSHLLIDATEAAKTLDQFTGYVEHLATHGARRGDSLIAVGGGIIQDIVCFLAATLLRGLDWKFYPTTLLAQADSCIGSKSSINVGPYKNLLGTFTPPSEIFLSTRVLKTLTKQEVRSGIGEMLKVHIIDGPKSFSSIAADFDRLENDDSVLLDYLQKSLLIKRRFIEVDEFDKGVRNVLNYGHSFGHAIESATHFAVPHGIAVTMGMDMANFVSARLGHASDQPFRSMHPTLLKNYGDFAKVVVPMNDFISAIGRDKKNTAAKLKLVLPDSTSKIDLVQVENDRNFEVACRLFFDEARI